MEGGVGVIADVFYNENYSTTMYRVLSQNSGIQLWFDENEVVILQKAS
jgi:hypothetical protein